MNPVAERIANGESVTLADVLAKCITTSREIADHWEATEHVDNPCGNKNCCHGDPNMVRKQRAHTAKLQRELADLLIKGDK